jgi:hypothetical protein
MARTVNAAQLISWVRSKGDWPSAQGTAGDFIKDAEILEELNAGIASLHRILASVHGYEYFRAAATLATAVNVETVSLPADFYKLLGLWWNDGSGMLQPIRRYMSSESENQRTSEGWAACFGDVSYSLVGASLRFVPTPQGIHSLKCEYAAAPVRLVGDLDTWDGYAGFEEYPVWYAVATFREKGDEDASTPFGRMKQIEADIRATASRDQNEPKRAQDLKGWPIGRRYRPGWR